MSGGEPIEVVWDKDDWTHFIDECKAAGWRDAVKTLRDSAALVMNRDEEAASHYYVAADFLESLSPTAAEPEETTDGLDR
jgi:hypothetical protein